MCCHAVETGLLGLIAGYRHVILSACQAIEACHFTTCHGITAVDGYRSAGKSDPAASNSTHVLQSSLVRSKLLSPFPPQSTHGFRALAVGPDEKLYVSIAAPFNIGECKDMFCTLQRLDLNGSGMETFARGKCGGSEGR